jgi:hypothetical protein
MRLFVRHLRLVQPPRLGLTHARAFTIAAISIAIWLLVLALYFWRERMLFADAPHILFRLVNDGTLQIQEYRWGSFITQSVPLLASKAGLPLKAVMVLYSASFNLFYLAVVLLLIFRHRRPDMALMFALYFLFFSTETFYWPNNEVHQGIGWMMLLLGEHSLGLTKNRPLHIRILVFAVLAILAIWTHPLVMLALGFLWCFALLEKRGTGTSWQERAGLSILLISIALWKYFYAYYFGWYDAGKLQAIDGLKFSAVPKAFTAPMAHGFLHSATTYYAVFCVFLLIGLAALVKARRFLLIALTILYALGYFFIVAHTHPGFDRSYIESEWMPMGFAAAVPAVAYALPRISAKAALILLLAGATLQSVWILRGVRPFQARLAHNNSVLQKMRTEGLMKAVVAEPDEALRKHLMLHWAAPVESLLQSALDGEVPQRTFIFLPPTAQDSIIGSAGRGALLGAFETRPVTRLHPRYFAIDTTASYQSLR